MDWKDIAGPVLNAGGTILGGILGNAPGAAIGQAVGGALAQALGCDPTPEAVSNAIQTNPSAPAIIAGVDQKQGPSLAELDNADRANARQQTIQLAQSGSNIAWGAPVVSVFIVVGFLGLVFALLFKSVPDSQVALVLFGTLSTAFGGVVNYWLGSSHSSATKDSTLAGVLKTALPNVAADIAKVIKK